MAVFEELLKFYHLDIEEYGRLKETPSFDFIPTIDGKEEVEEAIKLLIDVRANKGKILVYGDYDTDGIMATSIMVKALREFGITTNGYLPSRYIDGYGLTVENVRKIAKSGYSLIFTVDNGITAFEAVEEAKNLGMKVIILDHHTPEENIPVADLIIHPVFLRYGEYPISAGFLSYLFSSVLLKKRDEYLFTMGAVSLISDMMPLKGHNRVAVKLMLEIMKRNKYPEFTALAKKDNIDVKVFGLDIIPRINSVGRIEKGTEINRLIAYFAENDIDKKKRIVAYLDEVNERRKEETKSAAEKVAVVDDSPTIVVMADIPEGLNGLLANRLLQQYGKPVAVFSKSHAKEGVLVGSLRSKPGFDIIKCLNGIKVDLVASGGHSFAGGATIREEDFELFKKEFSYSALKHEFEKKGDDYIPLELSECNATTFKIIESFAPFGTDWPEPKFILRDLNPNKFTYIKDGKYMLTWLGKDVKLLSFSINEDTFKLNNSVDLSITFQEDEFRGKKTLTLYADKA